MKFLKVFLIAVFLAVGTFAIAQPEEEVVVKDEPKPEVFCPATKYSDNNRCSDCHTMLVDERGKKYFGLKEVDYSKNYSGKPYFMDIVNENGEYFAYMLVKTISDSEFRYASQYLYSHPEFKKLVVEIHSPGGSVMSAWRSVGIIEEMQKHGIIVETRCYGLAASAGGILLIAGDIGHRYIAKHAEVMIHKVWQFSMFDIADPDSAEDKANILKHFQENINKFFQERTNLDADTINQKTYHKMYWFNGMEAVEHGVADHLIGE